MNRGDVVLVRFPHPSGLRGKKRPAVIVQSDAYAGTVSTFVVAEVTKNLTMADNPACLFIDASTAEGRATGSSPQFRRLLLGARHRVRGRCPPGAGSIVADHDTKARRLPESCAGAPVAITGQ